MAQLWRGNVRELRNVLEQIMLRSDTPRIGVELVEQVLMESGSIEVSQDAPLQFSLSPTHPNNGKKLEPLAQQISKLEKMAITQALEATQGNKSNAAKLLGISRAKLYERLGSSNPS